MNDYDGRLLLDLARRTIQAHLVGEALPSMTLGLATEPADFGGAFVTLRTGGRLRGCIGRFNPDHALGQTVQEMAIASLADPRFQHCPVGLADVPTLQIEISILSKMERTLDPLSLVPGVHGVYIRRGYYSGCFLPQVATEQGWDCVTFLSRCCADKAGLPADAWKDPATEVHLFTCTVLNED